MELTQAEKEMIALKREQEALAIREAELNRQAELEKKISDARITVKKQMASDQEQIAAAREYAKKMPGANLKITIWQAVEKVHQYNEQNEWIVVHEEPITREEAAIHFDEYKIRVAKHFVYSGKWGRHSTDKGYKMFVSGPGIKYQEEGRALSNPATAIKKIQEAIDTRNSLKLAAERQKSALETTIEKMKRLYPNAMVTSDRGSEKNYRGHYEGYDAVTIFFANGIKIKYKVYGDGSLGRKDISFDVKDAWELMAVMSKVRRDTVTN